MHLDWVKGITHFCQIYYKLRADAITLFTVEPLSVAIKTVNETTGPSGLVPNLLLFGILTHILPCMQKLLTQTGSMKAMQCAKFELRRIICKQKLDTFIRPNVLADTLLQYAVKDEVLMYREKLIGKRVSLYRVAEVDDKQITLDTGERMTVALVDKIISHLDAKKALSNAERNKEDVNMSDHSALMQKKSPNSRVYRMLFEMKTTGSGS